MAFDGITVAALVKEISNLTINSRIYKIQQPEKDELLLTIKGNSNQFKLLLSASATLPLVYVTDESKPAPMTAPNFCMLLRKHLTNARILSVSQPGLERIICFHLEHLDEMGDVCHKKLIIELMGKHSNIIFTEDDDTIIDSIKHISHNISSLREVLPGRKYFIPETSKKLNPLYTNFDEFKTALQEHHMDVSKALYTSYTGLSPLISSELSLRAGIDCERNISSLSDEDFVKLFNTFQNLTDALKTGNFEFNIYYEKGFPKEYAAVSLSMFKDLEKRTFSSISKLLISFYSEKAARVRILNKSSDLRHLTETILERDVKKLDLQKKQLADTEKKEKYRVYGELINTYGYEVTDGSKSFKALNYYTGEEITIPLDPLLSVKENAKKYFDKYTKLKRTAESLTEISKEVSDEIDWLSSIMTSLDIAETEDDLNQIKEELVREGFIRHKSTEKKKKIASKPLHYVSADGFDIYVGKNNTQNDWLTFEFATGGDWWFHAKKMPGSHVILKTNGREVPDLTFEEAARLAAHYSSGRGSDKIEIDYLLKKNVKKPAKAKPGFVVYYTNYSMTINDDISGIKQE